MYTQKHVIVLLATFTLLSLISACTSMPRVQAAITSIPSSGTEPMKGYLTIQDGRLIEYEIQIPLHWIDKLEVRKEENITYYDYAANPKQAIFSVAAFTEVQWQELQQEPGRGEKFLSQDGIVYVYHVALDNPYTGSTAEEFQQMAGQVKQVVNSLTASIISDPEELGSARNVLVAFFDLLSKGEYSVAAELYGGTYENLIDLNPSTNPDDHAALLEQACMINGFQCFPVKQVLQEKQEWPDGFIFKVEFTRPDGSLLELGPCCGETVPDSSPKSQFDFTVMRIPQEGNIYLVRELPVYIP